MDIKKIDFSDVRLLMIGVVLLLVPVAFFALQMKGSSSDFSSQAMGRDLQVRRSSFNLGPTPGSTVGGGGGGGGGWSAPRPEAQEKAIQNELDQVYRKMMSPSSSRGKPAVPDLPGFSDADRQMFSAEINPTLGNARGFVAQGDFDQAEQGFRDALAQDPKNPFLQMHVFAGLAGMYQKMGKQDEYEKAFREYLAALGRLPEGYAGPMAKNIQQTADMLGAMMHQIDRVKLRLEIQKACAASGVQIDDGKAQEAMGKMLNLFPKANAISPQTGGQR